MIESLRAQQTTTWILRGTFITTTILSLLLIRYEPVVHSVWSVHHLLILLATGVYFLLTEFSLRHQNTIAASWLLVSFYKALSGELEEESAALRQAQLKQIRELHKFALLGQSTAATLHDLSSHLSVLNLDIDDLQQQNANSAAIANAKESIRHINSMVRQARRQLNSYNQREVFNACDVVERSTKDMQDKLSRHNITLHLLTHGKAPHYIKGSTVALMQVITILLNNAIEACGERCDSEISLLMKRSRNCLIVSVIDNGPGITAEAQRALFKPKPSTKPSGMGIGLYIALHLVKNHFNGTLTLKPSRQGAHFLITIPYSTPPKKAAETAALFFTDTRLAT